MNPRTALRPLAHEAGPGPLAGDFPADPLQTIRIGDLAARTGVTVETLRYYERRRLLRPSGRRPSGYREYEPDAVGLVKFIKRAQALGFTLAEVEELVRLREQAWSGDATRRLRDAIVAKVDDIDRRVRELRELGEELGAMIAACDAACASGAEPVAAERSAGTRPGAAVIGSGMGVLDCPLVEALDTEAAGRALLERRTWPKHPDGQESRP